MVYISLYPLRFIYLDRYVLHQVQKIAAAWRSGIIRFVKITAVKPIFGRKLNITPLTPELIFDAGIKSPPSTLITVRPFKGLTARHIYIYIYIYM